MTNSRGPG